MKIGIRKPSLTKSLKARTTGKLKRAAKRAVNPLYGKKGMGLATDPEKAVYNKMYNKTTVGIRDIVKDSHTSNSDIKHNNETVSNNNVSDMYKISNDGKYIIINNNKIKIKSLSFLITISYIVGILCLLVGIPLFLVGGFILVIIGIVLLRIAKTYKRIQKELNKKDWN